MLSRSMPSAICAMRGISMSGLSSGSRFSSSERRTMVTAESPMRSRLLEIFDATSMKRQSVATGAWVAMWLITRSSTVISSWSSWESSASTAAASFSSRSTRARMARREVAVGQAGHHEQGFADVRDLLGGGAVGVGDVGHGLGKMKLHGASDICVLDQPKRPLM